FHPSLTAPHNPPTVHSHTHTTTHTHTHTLTLTLTQPHTDTKREKAYCFLYASCPDECVHMPLRRRRGLCNMRIPPTFFSSRLAAGYWKVMTAESVSVVL